MQKLLQGNTTFSENLNQTWTFEDPEPVICMFYNPDFIIYSSLGSFYIPCLIMIVLYTRIFKVKETSLESIYINITISDSACPSSAEQVPLRLVPGVSALCHGHPARSAVPQGDAQIHSLTRNLDISAKCNPANVSIIINRQYFIHASICLDRTIGILLKFFYSF